MNELTPFAANFPSTCHRSLFAGSHPPGGFPVRGSCRGEAETDEVDSFDVTVVPSCCAAAGCVRRKPGGHPVFPPHPPVAGGRNVGIRDDVGIVPYGVRRVVKIRHGGENEERANGLPRRFAPRKDSFPVTALRRRGRFGLRPLFPMLRGRTLIGTEKMTPNTDCPVLGVIVTDGFFLSRLFSSSPR